MNCCLKKYIVIFTNMICLLFASISFLCCPAYGEETDEEVFIEVRATSTVNTRKIYLGDIAEIQAPELLKRKMKTIHAGFAPSPGEIKLIDGKRLKSKLESNRLINTRMALVVPDKIYIKRGSQEISPEELKEIFIRYVRKNADHRDYEIRNFSIRGLDVYPEGDLFLSPPLNRGRDVMGRLTLYMDVQVDGNDYGRISLTGTVDMFDDVVCASKFLQRGTILSNGDVQIKRINISKVRDDFLTDPRNVSGLVTRTSLKEGSVIALRMLDEPDIVQRGDIIKLVVENGALRIVTLGISRSDGKRNDTIRVENIRSGKIVNAIVTGKGSAKVF